jgi:hypothetical protein
MLLWLLVAAAATASVASPSKSYEPHGCMDVLRSLLDLTAYLSLAGLSRSAAALLSGSLSSAGSLLIFLRGLLMGCGLADSQGAPNEGL